MLPGTDRLDEARSYLADDLRFTDPLMQVADADDLIRQVRRFSEGAGEGEPVPLKIHEIIESGNVVAVLNDFPLPGGDVVTYSQWFWLENGKIVQIQVVYDPRLFLR